MLRIGICRRSSSELFPVKPCRRIGVLLFLGVLIFSAATVVAEPFEQETPSDLYQAIAENGTTYRSINLLAGVGLILVLLAWTLLARHIPQTQRPLTLIGLGLLALATLLWLVEVFGRITTTADTAARVVAGASVPTTFPSNVGVGFEPLFVTVVVGTLAGLSILFWQVGQAGLLSERWSLIGAAVIVISGAVAALTYPWVGGVERVVFYPFALVLLPFAIFLLARRRP